MYLLQVSRERSDDRTKGVEKRAADRGSDQPADETLDGPPLVERACANRQPEAYPDRSQCDCSSESRRRDIRCWIADHALEEGVRDPAADSMPEARADRPE